MTAGNAASPFHEGEQRIHKRLGIDKQMSGIGGRMIRDFMPDQHRDFYQQLPFLFVGYQDDKQQVWASILHGTPGFATSPHPKSLVIDAKPLEGDPLAESLNEGMYVGMLGIELPTRRRNRLSGKLAKHDGALHLDVVQTCGNCPQYIQTRHLQSNPNPSTPKVHSFTQLNDTTRAVVQKADTFFVATHSKVEEGQASTGADVSHRGGKPGFVRVDDDSTLTIPDYLGNFMFFTLGNIESNPATGLLFIDFETGSVLSLTGEAEILWDDPDTVHFEGAERLWRFKIKEGRWLENALPFRWQFNDYADTTQVTGTWKDAEQSKAALALADTWQNITVSEIKQESRFVKSFYLEMALPKLPPFKGGQFLTLKANIDGKEETRCYTVSSPPGEPYYRISVKREEQGMFSRFLHDHIKVGDTLSVLLPSGDFFFDPEPKRPAVMLAAGIGITPMISMLHYALKDAVRTRHLRPITLLAGVKNGKEQSFAEEVSKIESASAGLVRAFWAFSAPTDDDEPRKDYQCRGRISEGFVQAALPLADYDFYLCGPADFMQDMYELCLHLGVPDKQIFAESFGDAQLTRRKSLVDVSADPSPSTQASTQDNSATTKQNTQVAQAALVTFKQTEFEQAWTPESGSLLEFAEAHGVEAQYGCRNGRCGSCKVKKISGEVHYTIEPVCSHDDDEIVMCCAVPAQSHEKGEQSAQKQNQNQNQMPNLEIAL